MQLEISTLLILLSCALGAALFAAFLTSAYRRDKREALSGLRSGSQIIETPSGPLEYSISGSGYPLIMLHGMGGGYEQGLLLGRLVDLTKFRVIAPSRPGHRRTPLITGATFEEQADAIIFLLDTFKIENALVLGLSGGGFAAMQFALRAPTRCKALILLSAHGPETLRFLPPRVLLRVFDALAWADFLLWAILKLPVQPLLGLEGSNLRRLRDPQNLKMVQAFMTATFPPSNWKDGTSNDIRELFALAEKEDWPLEDIKAPTLVLHGDRDFIVRPATARLHAERIPGAQLTTFADGTHFSFATHRQEIHQAIANFLERHRLTN